MAYGDLPRDFELVREGRSRFAVRRDLREALLPLLRRWVAGALPAARDLVGGRGGAGAFDIGLDLSVVLRPYRRGGLIGRFNHHLYLGFRPRPLRELRVTEALRAAGVPTIEPLAAAVHWVLPGCYRGALVSLEVPLAVNLWRYLCEVEPAERERACSTAAMATRRLHDAGAVHPDLNLQNYLVRRGTSGREVMIIDFDQVRLASVSARDRQAAFARLCRSIRRLDPQSAVLTLGCVEALRTIELEE